MSLLRLGSVLLRSSLRPALRGPISFHPLRDFVSFLSAHEFAPAPPAEKGYIAVSIQRFQLSDRSLDSVKFSPQVHDHSIQIHEISPWELEYQISISNKLICRVVRLNSTDGEHIQRVPGK